MQLYFRSFRKCWVVNRIMNCNADDCEMKMLMCELVVVNRTIQGDKRISESGPL